GIRDRNVTGVQTCALPICKGTITPPIAVDAAMAELEIDPNKAFPIMFVCANDPGTLPPNSLANSTSLFAIPPRFMIIPDNIKNGTATNEKLSKLETIPCAEIGRAHV